MKVVWALLMIVVTGFVSAEGQRSPGRLHDETVVVSLEGWTTDVGGAKHKTATADTALRVGQQGSIYATRGFGSITNELCSGSVGAGGDREALLAKFAHLWWVEVEVVEATTQKIELAIDWKRHDRRDDGTSIVSREGRRTIILEEEQSHVLDFLEPQVAPGSEGRCGLNVLYELRADVIEDPKLADARLQYSFSVFDWEDGKRRTHTTYAHGVQGERVEITPVSIRWPIGRRTPDGKTADVAAEIRGSILGRLRVDGSIDLFLDADRMTGVARPGQPARGGIGGGGTLLFNVMAGETIELVLPTPGGSHTEWIDPEGSQGRLGPEPDSDGITVAKNLVNVDFGLFFAERKMSIFVTATLLGDGEEGVNSVDSPVHPTSRE